MLNKLISNKTIIIIGLLGLCFLYPENRDIIVGGLLGFLTDNLIDNGGTNGKNPV